MTAIAYLAGPDVFLPNAVAHAATKVERGLPPLNEDAETADTELEVWQTIFEKDIAMMEKSDIIIANLTPFAGASVRPITLRSLVQTQLPQPIQKDSPPSTVASRPGRARTSGSDLNTSECFCLFQSRTAAIAKVDQRVENPQYLLSLIGTQGIVCIR